MRRLLPLLPLVALAGCIDSFGGGTARAPGGIPEGAVRVSEVAVRPGAVTIRTSDGARCVSERPEGTAAGWSGVTADCGYALPYTVTFARGGDPSRFVVEEPGGAITADGTPGPRAEVFVTDVDGVRRLFVVPLPDRFFADAAS